MFPPLRAGWIKRGQSKPVLLSGFNTRRVIIGALNLRTGNRLFMESDRQDGFDAFMDLVAEQYRAWDVHLLLDKDPSHIDEQTQVLAQQYGIELHWLPHRAPEPNPMDTFWGQAKDVVCTNKQYAILGDLGVLAVHIQPGTLWRSVY